jgi:hypothetical protein
MIALSGSLNTKRQVRNRHDPNPLTISIAFVTGLAHTALLAGLNVVAVVPE